MLAPVLAPRPVPVRQPLRWRLLQFVMAYLPLLLMAALALGTLWLVKNTPNPDDAYTARPARHQVDYAMQHFAVQRYAAQGPLRAQIEGDTLRHYPDTNTVEIDNVHLRAVGPDGRITLASARQAIANDAATEVQLLGGAEVVREAVGNDEAIYFHSEFLHAFLDTERVRTHLPVTVSTGSTQVRADGMEYDHLARVIHFNGRMRASFAPQLAP